MKSGSREGVEAIVHMKDAVGEDAVEYNGLICLQPFCRQCFITQGHCLWRGDVALAVFRQRRVYIGRAYLRQRVGDGIQYRLQIVAYFLGLLDGDIHGNALADGPGGVFCVGPSPFFIACSQEGDAADDLFFQAVPARLSSVAFQRFQFVAVVADPFYAGRQVQGGGHCPAFVRQIVANGHIVIPVASPGGVFGPVVSCQVQGEELGDLLPFAAFRFGRSLRSRLDCGCRYGFRRGLGRRRQGEKYDSRRVRWLHPLSPLEQDGGGVGSVVDPQFPAGFIVHRGDQHIGACEGQAAAFL